MPLYTGAGAQTLILRAHFLKHNYHPHNNNNSKGCANVQPFRRFSSLQVFWRLVAIIKIDVYNYWKSFMAINNDKSKVCKEVGMISKGNSFFLLEYTLHLVERCIKWGEIMSLSETNDETMVYYVFYVRFLHYNLPVRSMDWVNWEQIECKVGFRNQWKHIKLTWKLTSEYLSFTYIDSILFYFPSKLWQVTPIFLILTPSYSC